MKYFCHENKLTLTIDETITKRAKRYAARHRTSLSKMVENFLESRTMEEPNWMPEPGSWVENLMGSIRLPEEDKEKSY